MDQEQQSRWRPTIRQVLWTAGIVVVLVVSIRSGIRSGIALAVLAIGGYLLGRYLTRLGDRYPRAEQAAVWTVGIAVVLVVLIIRIGYDLQWTGFGESKVAQDVRPEKTLWDWLDLLIVPVVLAIGGYLFTRSEARATQAAADRRAQDDALQGYLDQMSAMLIPNKEQPSLYKAYKGDSLSSVARARTLTVLPRLNPDHKARVVQFLYESGLIAKVRPILDLRGADLRGAKLRSVRLSGADLSGTDLREANLTLTDLRGANLSTDLSEVTWNDLSRTNLSGADLALADLSGADLSGADLSGAKLGSVRLSGADLTLADLSGADLNGATLNGTKGWTEEQLAEAESLTFATMPDGQQLDVLYSYDDWLKSKGSGENGENNSP